MSGVTSTPDLSEVYTWPEGWWVRAMLVQTIDGAFFGPDGKSRSISSDTDRQVLMETRRLADVVLVGAQTIRSERYRPMVAKQEWQSARSDRGCGPAPVVAIVSASLNLPWEEPLFGESAITPLVFTDGSADPKAKDQARLMQESGKVEIVQLPNLPASVLSELRARGYQRIVCEGGPRLLRDLFPVIDELDITYAPMILGSAPTTASVNELPVRTNWRLDQHWEHEGFVFTKYVRA